MKMKDDDYKVREVSNGYIVLTCADNSETIFASAKEMGEWFAKKAPVPEVPEVIPQTEAKGSKSAT